MTRKELKEIIREILKESGKLNEMTGSGAAGAYSTPFAFSRRGSVENANKSTKKIGYTTVGPISKKNIAESRYHNFKQSDEMRNHAKISYGLREAKKRLSEIGFLVNICSRLKTECNVDSSSLWKRTAVDIQEIQRQIKEIAVKLKSI